MPIPEWIFQGTLPLVPPEPKKNSNLSAVEKQRRQTLINEAKPKWKEYLDHYDGKRPGPAHTGFTDWTEPPSAGSSGPETPSADSGSGSTSGSDSGSTGSPPPGSGSSAPSSGSSSDSGSSAPSSGSQSQTAGKKLLGEPPGTVELLSCSEIKARCNEFPKTKPTNGDYSKCYKRVVGMMPPFGFGADKPAFDRRDGYKYAYMHPNKTPQIPPEYVAKYYPDSTGNYEEGFKVVQKCVGDEPEETQGTESDVLNVEYCNMLKDKKGITNLSPDENEYYQKCKLTYPHDYN